MAKAPDVQSDARGLALIRQALVGAVDKVGPELLRQLTERYRREVDDLYNDAIIARLDDRSVKGRLRDTFTLGQDYYNWYALDYDKTRWMSIDSWDDLRKARKYMSHPGYKRADQAAKDSYESARYSFIEKNVGKFKEVLGKREDVKSVDISFAYYRGVFEGSLEVGLGDGSVIIAQVSLKYVVRTTPRVTPYYQYPLLFGAKVAGQKHKSLSEEELRVLLGGGTAEQHQAERATQAAAEGWCPESGKFVPQGARKVGGRYRECVKCGTVVAETSWGKYLKHKTPAATKAVAASKLTDAGYCPMSRMKVSQAVVDSMGPVDGYKDPKVACESCGQQTRLDADKEWIRDQFLSGDGYPTKQKVMKAKYLKHKLSK